MRRPSLPERVVAPSGEDAIDRMGRDDSREPPVQAAVGIRERLVIQPHEVQDRRVHVADVVAVHHGLGTDLVRLSVRPGAHAGAREPHREALRVVVAAARVRDLELAGELAHGLAPELAAPDDERLVEQAACARGRSSKRG